MNPTNYSCPSDISRYVQTDYRPNKSLYVNVNNNNQFRLYMQRNADKIRQQNLKNYVDKMYCGCENRKCSSVKPFDYASKIKNMK